MRPNNIEDIYPLSPMQQGILFHTLYAGHPETYAVQIGWTLRGALDVDAFKRAWQEVFDRHPALRTAFAWEKLAEPVQIVWKKLKLVFEDKDLRGLPVHERHDVVRSIAEAEHSKGFDPTRAPLMRFALIRLADDMWRFLWGMHHLLVDGWSTQIVIKEVFALYASYTGGAAPKLERARPYGEYIGWLKKQDGTADATFWRKELAGFTASTPFSVDLPAEGEPRFGETHTRIPESATTAIAAFMRQHQLTVNTALHGAWAILLSRYSREDDVLFGSTVSGRSAPIPGIEGMVGLFINTVPVRVRIQPEQPLLDFLKALQQHEAELRDHEHCPLTTVQLQSDVPRGVPLFESLVVFENFPFTSAPSKTGERGIAVSENAVAERPPYPLTLTALLHRTLSLRLSYDARRFHGGAIERMLAHFTMLLQAMVADPQARISDLTMLSAEERERVVVEWNRTKVDYPREATIHALFEKQAAATPDAIAVTLGDARLTYAELNRRARQLAHHLRRRGASHETPVGLFIHRSLDMVVATLAVLKAGSAYVPIDPDLPSARRSWMIADAGVRLVVSDTPLDAGIPIVCISADADRAAIDAEPADELPHAGTAESLAYIMYTSGSAGTPKGVCVVHRGVTRLVKGSSFARLTADEVFLQLAPTAFDAATLEIWGPLLNGGRLVLFPPEPPSATRIGDVIRKEGVTTLWLTAGLFNAVIDQSPGALRPLSQILTGGEALSVQHVAKALAELPGVTIINGYGPTENTTFTCCHSITSAGPGSIPIGRPIANTTVYVLDERRQPTPIGVPGELYAGGDGLARGYLNRPELTTERFIENPFQPGERLYRTGDLVRWLSDGTLAFLGRLDFQVKLRGFRIELGEIEATLGQVEDVGECAVIVREDAPGDRRLVAYIVSKGERPNLTAVRAALRDQLPEYMVPSSFVLLETMPLTTNGKLDRRALPLPDANVSREHVYEAPRTPIEQALAGLFADVLHVPTNRVGIHDSFFELGGHSLLATQIATRIRAVFGVDLPLRAIFDAPTLVELASRVESALRAGKAPVAPPLQQVSRDVPLPLSFAQERLWFLTELDPASPAYVVALGIGLRGTLDECALEEALTEIVRRHEVLRTTFVANDGKPMQVIHPSAPFPIARTSLTHLPSDAQAAAIRAEASAEARRPFDLTAGPVIRARLVGISPEQHILLLTMHHIVADQWTSGILNRELTTLYTAFHEGRSSPLPDLDVQYADYAAWQRQWLSGNVLDQQIAYWKTQLAGAPHTLDLAFDRPRPPVQSFRGNRRLFSLNLEQSSAIQELARREGATLYMTLLASFCVFLQRHSGQDDLLIGTPIAGRTRSEIEGLIGCFLNTLVMRARLSPEMTFKELLTRMRDTALGAYAHQDMPFERLVQELAPEPDPSRGPLFQVIFNLHNAPREALRLPGLTLHSTAVETATVKADLTLMMAEQPSGLTGRIEYATDLFDEATIDRFVQRFETLLASILRNPQRRLREQTVLTPDELRRVLIEWNDTALSYETNECFHELFEAQVDATPSAPALVAGITRLTYAELDQRANRLAHHLRARGVGPDAVVGLYCERSADLVTGVLGILKAGGAYVPLDPTFPPQRIAQILAESHASVVVTHTALAERIADTKMTVVRVDADAKAIAGESDARPTLCGTPGNLAYVLFTSGSTGMPKGVAIEHRQLVNYVRGIQTRLALPSGATYAHVSSFSADLGNTVLFVPLASGGCMHLIERELTTDPDGLGIYFQQEGIDCLKIAPTHLAVLLTGAHPERVLPREIVVVGGEGLTWDLVDRIEALAPRCRILNHYAPTECTVGVLTHTVAPGVRIPGTAIAPLGRPLPNSRIYLLDAAMQPVPPGVPGEVFIGGAGVSRGYLNLPDLTRARFISDPFSSAPGSRLYRSGDRARTLPDGAIQFLGRIDFQVKIRGFRVELGEIEAGLLACQGVMQAVVLANEDTPGNPRLVAYVVGDVAPSKLRAELDQQLPDYMVPSAFIILETLPLTDNGKVDRRALAAIVLPSDKIQGDAPRSPVEDVLATIWASIFHRDKVGIHERFSDLGGHSLLAIQIIARAREAFHVQVPLRAIFEAPTVALLAEHISALLRAEGLPGLPSIERADRDGTLPLSFAEERLWVLDRLEPNAAAYNVSWGLRLDGPLDHAELFRALQEVMRRHEILRTTFTFKNEAPVRVIHPKLPLSHVLEDLTALPIQEREARIRAVAAAGMQQPFDLEQGPLFRAQLLRLSPDEHALMVSMHHIVSDASTHVVLGREIAALYSAFQRGETSPLPELPLQYADYAAWQRSCFAGDVLSQHLTYWRDTLAGVPAVLDLPSDRPRPPRQSYRGARAHFRCSASVREALVQISKRSNATLFMTLLAAFDVLLYRWSGQRTFVVGTPAMNRTHQETEALIGCFLNTLVIRADVNPELTFQDLLGCVRESCLGAYTHQELPFEQLVEVLAPERDLSRTPIFQVMFTLLSARRDDGAFAGVRRRAISAPIETAKFDLTLFVTEGPGGITGTIEYATDLFDAATMDRMAAQVVVLLESLTAASSTPIHAIKILPEAERALVTATWNATAAPYPRDITLVGLVQAQVARTPDAIAVSCEGRELTYRALDEQSNQLARALLARGAGRETLVGISVDRKETMVIGLLGILKTGAAYVPLDPTYPRERIALMVADAQLRVLVTEATLEAILPQPPPDCTVVRLDADQALIVAEPSDPLPTPNEPHDLAYVIYTSGSTGKPKGVQVPHRAVVNFLVSMAKEPGMNPGDRILAVTSLSFDIAGLELWLPLTVGARVEIVGRAIATDGAAINKHIAAMSITVMQATPSTFRLMLDAGWAGHRELKALVGGEAVPRELAMQLLPKVASLWNMYGPTETTIWSCVHRLTLDAPIFIGRPIANTQVYVRDTMGALAPIGVPGELAIGGDGVAHGYLGRPELTAERFVDDPFSVLPGARLYRTGDLVRWRPEGLLEFLGRMDFQVKIRGFRVELGEIEAILGLVKAVKQAVVVAREFGPADLRLIAYIVPADPTTPPSPNALRAHVRVSLPEAMVPVSFVVLDTLPLTPAGKVDRRALPLPMPSNTRAHDHDHRVMPRDQDEVRLAALWRGILKLDKVGVTESFFDLGGHSLLAVRMMSEVERIFGKKLPLAVLFEAQTIEALVQMIRRDHAPSAWPALVPIRPNGQRRPLFFVARPNVNLLGYIALVRRLDPDQPVYGLQLQYPEETTLGRPYSIEERSGWASQYLELVKAVQPEGPYLIAGMCEGAFIAFDMVRRLEEQGEEVKFFGVLDTWPEENTSRKFLHRIFIYERDLRGAWKQGIPEISKLLWSRTRRLLRYTAARLRPEAPTREYTLAQARVKLWEERSFPGPSFVPLRVKCRIDIFRVRHAQYWRINDPEFGWGNRTLGGVDIHFIDGDHLTFMREQNVPLLAQRMRDCLRIAEEEIARDALERARNVSSPETGKPAPIPIREHILVESTEI